YAGPSALPNLLAALRQRTALAVAERERVVTLTGPELWDVPYVFMTGHGNVRFSDEEVTRLRRWLEQGGFLHADDDYGMDKSFRREIARVFPDHPLVEVPLSHPIYHLLYDFPRGAGVAFAIAGAGLRLAPRVAAVVVAWLLIAGLAGAALSLVRRAGRPAAPAAVGRLVETTAGTRAGSVVGVLAPAASAGASAELLALADARAAAVVERAAPAVGRLLARGTRASLVVGAGAAAVGAALFVASSPGAGRAAAFWHPLRASVDARAPARLTGDRATV